MVGKLISQEIPDVKKYIAIKIGGYGYSFEFFGVSDKSGVYLNSTSNHISVSRYNEKQANKVLFELIGTEIENIPDYYGDFELGNVVINGQDLCAILRIFDGTITYEAVFLNPHFLISSREMKGISIEHAGVALLNRIEKYLEHNLPLPLSKWEKNLNQGIVNNNSSAPKQRSEEYLSDVRESLFYELKSIEKQSNVK